MSIKYFSLFISVIFIFSINVNAQQNNKKGKTYSYESLDFLSKLPNSHVRRVYDIKEDKLPGNVSLGVKTISFKDILGYAERAKFISQKQEKEYATGSNSSCSACKKPITFCVKDLPDNCKCAPVSNVGLLLKFKSLPDSSVTCNRK
ncbi:MAG: hypothetical protein M1480_07265 [Bacteroidetes bacterium]|nr:hypothetical protein [Bacteroidota bacterium]